MWPAKRPLLLHWIVGLVATACIVLAVARLEAASQGVLVQPQWLGATPVTVFRPPAAAAGEGPPPVVLIAHGFAGSQQLMQPFAVTLARQGFVAITFDFPGHGRHGQPMRGGLTDPDASLRTLLASMEEMGAFARGLAGANGRYAVVGHSMASDIVVRHAQTRPEVQATVGVSLFAPSITADTPGDSPRNLLVVAGAWEPGMMATEALRVVGRVAGDGATLASTYGSFDAGTARRAVLAPGVEHIGVLYSAATLAETLSWLNAAFGRPVAPAPFIDSRGPWLGWLLLGVLALAWSLARCLPVAAPLAAAGSPRMPWWQLRGFAPVLLLPPLLTPLLLWPVPTDVLPLLLGDYLVLHFALYGVLTLLGLWWLRRPWPAVMPGRRVAFAMAAALATAYALLAVGLPLDRYVFNVQPTPARWPLMAAMLAGTLPYFLADEWLTRGDGAARGAYFASKLCFLLSLVVAIALNPSRLFFLAIIVPAILLLFVLYGLFSRWTFRRTGHPVVAALANALAFAAFIAVTFPLVS